MKSCARNRGRVPPPRVEVFVRSLNPLAAPAPWPVAGRRHTPHPLPCLAGCACLRPPLRAAPRGALAVVSGSVGELVV